MTPFIHYTLGLSLIYMLIKSISAPCDHNYEQFLKIDEKDIVLDVGSAMGCFALPISKKASSVIVLEPNPKYFATLKTLIFKYNIENIVLVDKAAWNEQGYKQFYIKEYESSVFIEGADINKSVIQVETDTIDNILFNLGITRIDFMKMDIEGAEIEALSGASNILNNTRKLVVASYHYRNNEQTYLWVDQYLRSKGFNTIISNDKLVHAWK